MDILYSRIRSQDVYITGSTSDVYSWSVLFQSLPLHQKFCFSLCSPISWKWKFIITLLYLWNTVALRSATISPYFPYYLFYFLVPFIYFFSFLTSLSSQTCCSCYCRRWCLSEFRKNSVCCGTWGYPWLSVLCAGWTPGHQFLFEFDAKKPYNTYHLADANGRTTLSRLSRKEVSSV